MIVWGFPCESRSLPGFDFPKKALLNAKPFLYLPRFVILESMTQTELQLYEKQFALSSPCLAIINLLADGKFHSGERIAEHLQISRTSVWKKIHKLNEYGIDIESIHSKGYRIPGGINLFDEKKIINNLSQKTLIKKIEVFSGIDSTNQALLRRLKQGIQSGSICLAEYQSAGRGRCNRNWCSPFGNNIYFSILWEFPQGAKHLAGLSLIAGVAIAQTLEYFKITNIGLKWPNDVLINGHKLAGVLTEIHIDSLGNCFAILGIGVNLKMPKSSNGGYTRQIEQPWIDLESIINQRVDKNQFVSLLIDNTLNVLQEFTQKGFQDLQSRWQQYDCLYGTTVTIENLNKQTQGIAMGIDSQGSLLLKVNEHIHPIQSGEIKLRQKSETVN